MAFSMSTLDDNINDDDNDGEVIFQKKKREKTIAFSHCYLHQKQIEINWISNDSIIWEHKSSLKHELYDCSCSKIVSK